MAATEGKKDVHQTGDQSAVGSDIQSDLFEDNFKELKKWVDLESSKYGTISVLRERRCGRLGTALKVFSFVIILVELPSICFYLDLCCGCTVYIKFREWDLKMDIEIHPPPPLPH